MRAQALTLKSLDFVSAARLSGRGKWSIARRELLPSLAAPVITYAALAFPTNIIVEAALSFLGVGIKPPTPSWGQMLTEADTWYQAAPTYLLLPAGLLFVTVLALTVLGEGVRTALDPRAASRLRVGTERTRALHSSRPASARSDQGGRGMTGFLIRRLGGAVLVLFALTAILYGIFYVAPGDVAQLVCGPRCSPAQVAQVTEQLRLNDPLYVQYGHFLQGIVAGRDFSTGTGVEHCSAPCLGVSYQSDQQVTQLILAKLPVTGSLVIGAFAGWLLLGVGTGVLSAWRRGKLTERVLTWLTLAGSATPVFVIGLLLIIVFCSTLQWLPPLRTSRSRRTPNSGRGGCCCPGCRWR